MSQETATDCKRASDVIDKSEMILEFLSYTD